MSQQPGQSNQISEDIIEIEGVGLVPDCEAFGDGRESVAVAIHMANRHISRDEQAPLSGSARKRWWRDKGLRVGGLALLGVSALALFSLSQLIRGEGRHEATAFEMLLAAIAFLCASSGSILLTQGIHLFDKVVVPGRRWFRD